MARSFVSASSQYLFAAPEILNRGPHSVMAWFRLSAAATALNTIFAQTYETNEWYNYKLQANVTADTVQFTAQDVGPSTSLFSSAGLTDGVWYHAGAWEASGGGSRLVYFGGQPGTLNEVNETPVQVDGIAIGSWPYAAVIPDVMDGDIAEVAFWNVVLTDAEFAMGAAGYSPLLIRPQSLVAYWPLWGVFSPEIDLFGGWDLTLQNAPAVADHPPIHMPAPLVYPTHPSLYYTSPRPAHKSM